MCETVLSFFFSMLEMCGCVGVWVCLIKSQQCMQNMHANVFHIMEINPGDEYSNYT